MEKPTSLPSTSVEKIRDDLIVCTAGWALTAATYTVAIWAIQYGAASGYLNWLFSPK